MKKLLLLWFVLSTAAWAEPSLQQQLEQMRQQATQLNRELFILEEELLFPAQTQLAVYLSVDSGQFFQLDSVQLLLNDKPISSHLYTEAQRSALERGAIQPLHKDNIRAGEHRLTAVFVGIGPEQQPYRRALTVPFNKGQQRVQLELKIRDSSGRFEPEFVAELWPVN
ncbi:AraC family transcriptional regulator [Arsukibacterium sp.]|uniref:AraC family transcriptional regulator n=1 Tax=Arsukibacterium sp. TaxID=1977258 RepID=UPI002FDB828C